MVVRPLAVGDDRTGPGVVGVHPIARGIRLTGNVGIRRRRRIACARSIDAIRDHDARAGVVGPLVHDVDRRRRNRRRLDGRGGVAAAAAAAATAAATASPADRRLGIGRQGRAAAAAAAGKDRLRIGDRLKDEGKGSRAPLTESFFRYPNNKYVLLALLGATAGQGVVWYTGQFYALFFLIITQKLSYIPAYVLIGLSLIIGTPFFIFFGWLSDSSAGCRIASAG
jgi:hypothetical protein